MEIVRSSLKILFKDISVEPILSNRTDIFDDEEFVRLFQRDNPCLSLDQCLLSATNVRQFFMRPLSNAVSLAFADQSASIMNVLLHFTKDILVEEDSYPVCRFEHLLRWHSLSSIISEDLLTTSYLASRDISSRKDRKRFDWNIVIGQNDLRLKNLFKKPMADVHMHLKGSSGNFDLNWLSLMNHILGRSEAFNVLAHILTSDKRRDATMVLKSAYWDINRLNDLYAMAIKACAIRLFLFKTYVSDSSCNDDDLCSFVDNLMSESDTYALFNSCRLDDFVKKERIKTAMNSSAELSDIYDYLFNPTDEELGRNPNMMLHGERCFLYKCFKACYGNWMSDGHCRYFYAYLVIKNKIRNELIQTNEIVGFRNFTTYECRKTIFIDNYRVYRNILEPLALGFYWNTSDSSAQRYIEPRIAPSDSANDLFEKISDIDNRVESMCKQDRRGSYHYVIHFIKKKDKDLSCSCLVHSRHHDLRRTICLQAKEIRKACSSVYGSSRIAGIDAANSEIDTRPEVFAQAFRFLKYDQADRIDNAVVRDLGMTYHVGEDFITIIDGLRAVDEVLHYMHFRRGSRLGHALVLGVDVDEYMRVRHNSFLLSKQMLLDDIAWMLNECVNTQYQGQRELERVFYSVFREVYDMENVSVRDYYDFWLLRGDNPCAYEDYNAASEGYFETGVSGWSRFDLNDEEEANVARRNKKARELYYQYHFLHDVRSRGAEIMEFRYPEGTEKLIKFLQQKMLAKLVKCGIGVETNPTSNIRIGGFRLYSGHPVHKFYPLNGSGSEAHLLTSVNTDDRGVFATSIEREYALLACAQFKKRQTSDCVGQTHDAVLNWLDALRNNGLIQRFRAK